MSQWIMTREYGLLAMVNCLLDKIDQFRSSENEHERALIKESKSKVKKFRMETLRILQLMFLQNLEKAWKNLQSVKRFKMNFLIAL